MLFVFLSTLLVYAFHSCGHASVSIFKPELALDICDTSVPEKVNSVLESTAFRSKRRCVRKEGRGKPVNVAWSQNVLFHDMVPLMKNTYHVTMVLLFLLL